MPVCSLNPSRSHYIDVADWKRIVDGERGRKLEEYWRGLAVEVQEKLAIDGCVRQILRELRLGRLACLRVSSTTRRSMSGTRQTGDAWRQRKVGHSTLGDCWYL